ncbi:putative long-chain-fatty-acid-CoA ligase [Aspergillus homomorphus CBS 101889]|uniref:Putative long-chain-fatty-acid-CoA ligase n=1 Tax=Aspergillus homomorphus (strain CBS 101889) TaxID=1450537 RepID=A0A395I6P7_ASPHC|nr:putative long-chain-fatty-acid-CoA ligase [Aspergillus homomorphus CBS 101889]RAL15882.1 putative long-chain-fatty-acid-CoA ligase [Aspergillus homomorphus CBS 101889]
MSERKSLVHGPCDPPLKALSISQLLDEQDNKYGSREAIVAFKTGARLTYHDLNLKTKQIARALVVDGVRSGDRVAIFLGNCEAYAEIFLAIARIGAIAVLLNRTYTPDETQNVLRSTGCSILFISGCLGNSGSNAFLAYLDGLDQEPIAAGLPSLRRIVLVGDDHQLNSRLTPWRSFLAGADAASLSQLSRLENSVPSSTACSFFLTSGTTGVPKIAMLTHANIINNAFLTGHRIPMSEEDIICNCLPLFHCGGLVLGLIICIVHGACVVFPALSFSASSTVESLAAEKCTGMHGVPTMFAAVLRKRQMEPSRGPLRLRTGIIGAAAFPETLWLQIKGEFDIENLSHTYGMTETSCASFTSDPMVNYAKRMPHALTILPHTKAKVIDCGGNIVNAGQRGELCIAGYLVQTGYFQNEEKTREALIRDDDGTLWMRTGDEAFFDEDGHCIVTGRIKDIIIRGGENIYPTEIEDRLSQHPSVLEACVVGLPDDHLGQVVSAFIQQRPATERPSNIDLAAWVCQTLSCHKAPVWLFWLGDEGVPSEFPLSGSGKICKNVLEEIGQRNMHSEKGCHT